MKLAVVDYGAGNIGSVLNVLRFLGEDPKLARQPEEILAADRIILPGVGAAGEAMDRLRAQNLDAALTEAVIKNGRPMLGICLGMQLLAERLHEFGESRGLGWIKGEVINIKDCVHDPALPVPHMGWNQVKVRDPGQDLFGLSSSREFYFAHSFTLRTEDKSVVAASVAYGSDLVAAVCKDTCFATQFHPEKSQVGGERLLTAFLEWNP
jgi:imidazole glycerol-phosphate synthase subunit HisH